MAEEKYVVSSAEIVAMEGLAKTHFLNPNGERINKSLGDMVGLTGFGFHIIEVAPGDETTEHHVHHHEDECVYILAGEATAYVGDEAVPVGAGDFIGYRKGGLAHSIKIRAAKRCAVSSSVSGSPTMWGTTRGKVSGFTGTKAWPGIWSITARSRNPPLARRSRGRRRSYCPGQAAGVRDEPSPNPIVTDCVFVRAGNFRRKSIKPLCFQGRYAVCPP